MLFKSLVPLTVYRGQSECPVPKGDPVGKGELIVLLSPNKASTINLLSSGFLAYADGIYKHYYADYIYNEKIGSKTIRERLNSVEAQAFNNIEFPSELNLISKGGLNNIAKSKRNVIVDFGKWNELFFANRRKYTPSKMSKEYLNFFYKKISGSKWDGYKKTILIDAAAWERELNSKIVFASDAINNPITMILFLLNKEPDALMFLKEFNYLVINSKERSLIYVPGSALTKENFGKLKGRVSSVVSTDMNIESIEDVDKTTELAEIKTEIKKLDSEDAKVEKAKALLKNRIAKNFVGSIPEDEEIDDVTMELDEDEDDQGLNIDPDSMEDDDEEPIVSVGDEIDDEIEKEIDLIYKDGGSEKLQELATSEDEAEIRKIAHKVSKKVFQNNFMPEYSKVQLNRIERLRSQQDEIIRPLQSKEIMESKIIDETSFVGVVNIPDEDMLHSRFVNFDKCYNEKKMERDIDEGVSVLSTASRKVFITEKKVEDSSNQLTLKETRTYRLEDENGKKMTVKFDVPKVIDNNYLFINGNKKILDHQFVSMPIMKNKSDEVKINTFYNKLIIRRTGLEDNIAAPILKYLLKHTKDFKVKPGNGIRLNEKYIGTLETALIGKKLYSFEVNGWLFITAIDETYEYAKKRGITVKKPTETKYPIAIHSRKKEVLYLDIDKESYGEKIKSVMNESDITAIRKINISKRQFYTSVEIMQKVLPLSLVILHSIGLSEMIKRAGIKTIWVPTEERKKLREYSDHDYGKTILSDGVLVWEREPKECAMLMTGVNRIDFSAFTLEEMDDKDTYIFCLNKFYAHANMSYNLDQYNDFMIDGVSKEILEDYNYPTDYIGLLLLANKLLVTTDFIPETDLRNMRIRGNELISYHVFKAITDAYNDYRKSANRVHAKPISVKQDEVMRRIATSSLTEEESVVNPFFEVEKKHSVTYHGNNGLNMNRAFSIDRRAYTESMLGIVAITTDNAENVGINRIMTLDPKITSTRGYLEFKGKAGVDELTNTNLLSAGELLTPLGVEHDDPARTAMAVKQSKAMIPVDNSEPGMITNGMDKMLPYHLSKEFCIVAEDDGVVVEDKNDLVVIKYNNGRYQTVDKSTQVKKNSAAGFYIVTNMLCDKKIGDKVKKNEVVGYEKIAFRKNNDDLSATMTRGPFIKIALVPRWDCYEDSNPITAKASDAMATTMSMEETAVLRPNMDIHYIAKIGDKINTGDPLLKFDQFSQDAEVQELMNMIRGKLKEDGDAFIESSATTIKAHYTGEIVDIKIYSTVPLEEMSESMQKIVGDYYKKLNAKINILKKYKNPDDADYYMSGQRIGEFPEPIAADDRGLLKGERVGKDGILFCFYIKFKDYIKKGDKITAEFALKGINSQVIEPGLEAYSEYRPDEEIGLIIAPHTPTARKTTGIFKSMFINKLLIEKKRQLMEYWQSVRDQIK